jgi:hypothetical protein
MPATGAPRGSVPFSKTLCDIASESACAIGLAIRSLKRSPLLDRVGRNSLAFRPLMHGPGPPTRLHTPTARPQRLSQLTGHLRTRPVSHDPCRSTGLGLKGGQQLGHLVIDVAVERVPAVAPDRDEPGPAQEPEPVRRCALLRVKAPAVRHQPSWVRRRPGAPLSGHATRSDPWSQRYRNPPAGSWCACARRAGNGRSSKPLRRRGLVVDGRFCGEPRHRDPAARTPSRGNRRDR